MKRWIEWLFRNNNRRLEVSVGGKWYLGFTILLGVAAINSGNNVIYLLESLLLSALILSGVLSEQTLLKTNITRYLGQARVGDRASDIILVENRGRIPLYCVEVGEWKNGQFHSIAFILILPSRAKIRVRSNQVFANRGIHEWDRLAVATSFPFGFAKKIRFLGEHSSRIVWPKSTKSKIDLTKENERRGFELELLAGEIEEVPAYGDVSRVHWPSSGRTTNLMAIPRGKNTEDTEVVIKLCEPGVELEKRISIAAGGLERVRFNSTLVLKEGSNAKKIRGTFKGLDALALLPRELG